MSCRTALWDCFGDAAASFIGLYEVARETGPNGVPKKPPRNREEKSLRHVAMVAKFLDDNKSKLHLKSGIALFQTSSILFNPFAPGDFAEKRVLKLVEWFSGHCRAIKS